MNIKFVDQNENPERKSIIKSILPEETIISTILEPSIEKRLFGILAECVRMELEIFKKYPKKPLANPEDAKAAVKDFNPTHNTTCFMGKGFKANTEIVDSELVAYRKAIGTIIHPTWGNCTLMEIWGGDHFEDHNSMVVGAFKYGAGLIKKCPTIKFHVNPLFQNKKSKEFKLSDAEIQHKKDMELLLTKALFFGVNEPKKKRRW